MAAKVLNIASLRAQTAGLTTTSGPWVQTHFNTRSNLRGGKLQDALLQRVLNSPTVDVIFNATAVDLGFRKGNASRANALKFKNDSLHEFVIQSGEFVLALGAVETARFLLNCRSARPEGIGNEHDVVGRYFCDHVQFHGGTACLNLSETQQASYRFPAPIEGYWSLDSETVHREQLNRILLGLTAEESGQSLATFDSVAREGAPKTYLIRALCEPNLHRDSRVTLTGEQDRFGSSRVKLEWRYSNRVHESLDTHGRYLARHLGIQELGRVKWRISPEKKTYFLPGPHHMCTTRMSTDKTTGVVDPDCRIHSAENIFIAGSSVFPVASCFNPTWTLLSLGSRLCDHLIKRANR